MDDAILPEDPDDFAERWHSLLKSADVISIPFTRVRHSLIVDFRRIEGVGPRVMTDENVASPHDRFLSFGRLRPSLALPEQLTLAFWTRTVRAFEETGLLRILRDRCEREGGQPLLFEVDDSYLYLLELERQYLCDMVRGVGMRTLWERARE